MTFEPPHINRLSRTDWTKEFLCFLFVVIGLALGFEPGFQLIRELLVGERFSAWATLTAAAIGFTAVAFQTRRGFEHLIASQKNQAELDREARADQAEIARRYIVDQRREKRKMLASALGGEISAISWSVSNCLGPIKEAKQMFEAIGNAKIGQNFDTTVTMPKIDPIVYKANISDLGVLGPSTAADVVHIYQMILASRTPVENALLTGAHLAKMFELQHSVLVKWIDSAQHVQQRLLSLLNSQIEDPGPLYFVMHADAIAAMQQNEDA